ncbi:hypothetical protein SADUNF_Sadunf09G0050600 [Salix dunnii]|uniref:Cytochrome P450 n=1 Tax=Salix dunnii TaxID=1413687 RepID=A0A835JQJ5_9ROSI|nr:hypothetical protein SADUNF_Sadunf09G0050600 [Salix dunnii]
MTNFVPELCSILYFFHRQHKRFNEKKRNGKAFQKSTLCKARLLRSLQYSRPKKVQQIQKEHNMFDYWESIEKVTISKNFMPFGGGTRQCAGAEYSKVVVSTFRHVLVTKYRFTKVKGGDVSRTPIISFGDGIQIKFTARN